jgi:hypothetical protein
VCEVGYIPVAANVWCVGYGTFWVAANVWCVRWATYQL